jgi:hypothetical protein
MLGLQAVEKSNGKPPSTLLRIPAQIITAKVPFSNHAVLV